MYILKQILNVRIGKLAKYCWEMNHSFYFNSTKIISVPTSVHELKFHETFHIYTNPHNIVNCEFVIYQIVGNIARNCLFLNLFQNFVHFCLYYLYYCTIGWLPYFLVFLLFHKILTYDWANSCIFCTYDCTLKITETSLL